MLHATQRATNVHGDLRAVRRRHVLFVGGYDPRGAAPYGALLARELRRFAAVWPVTAQLSGPDTEGTSARWRIEAGAAGWSVTTAYEFLGWDDLVRADMMRSIWTRPARVAAAYLDLLLTGTVRRVFKAHWRFGLFLLYPFVLFALLIAASALSAWAGAVAAGPSVPHAVAAAIAAGTVVFAAGSLLLKRWFAVQLAEMWAFMRDTLHGRRADFDRRIDVFGDRLAALARCAEVDEIVIVGHSYGAVAALMTLARALARDPSLTQSDARIVLTTLGSVLPAAALHPAGARLRDDIARIAGCADVAWVDHQSRKDVINFYKFDPVADLGLALGGPRHNPRVNLVRFRDHLAPATYRRFRANFFRMHFQFIMANDVRANYDYMMMICGPAPASSWSQADIGCAFGPDASYRGGALTAGADRAATA